MENEFMENRQNYMMDNNSIQQLNVASAGDGVVGGVQAEVVSGVAGDILGGKYDEHHEEHDVGDDDELKYVEEVQQSEKQQQQQLQTLKNIGLDDDGIYESNELADRETSHNAAHDFGNKNGGFVFGGDHHHHHEKQQKHDLFGMGNGHDTNGHDIVNTVEDFGTLVSTGFEEKLSMMESELDGFKTEAEFLSTSSVTETAEGFIPHVDLKIETKLDHNEMLDEEEPSSLATNTTNGTSSLSENILPQAHIDTQVQVVDNLLANLEDKENSDPLLPQRPHDLDLEQGQSQLNPDAKEFIPSFGSNPGSPTSPFGTVAPQNEPVLSEVMETQMYFGQAPAVVPRHLMEDDDFVAQSPCKGKDDNNMDTVLVPRELSEFEQEADKRPHELEPEVNEGLSQSDEVMTPDQAIQQLPLDDIETQKNENQAHADSPDFQPTSFMDHGPETCVDLETDSDMPPTTELSSLQSDDDVMKRSMYVANDDAIEAVLNSVQPIPTEIDSVNNSFIEESATESAANQLAGDKELLQVEEKEHVSHSPSTEEIQMNLQNNLNSSNKDIPQLPIDMQESLFLKQDQNIPYDREQNENISAENPFELEDILKNQQQPAKPEEVENQLLFQEELNKEPDNHMSLVENLNKVDQTETEKEQHMREPAFEHESHDQLPLQEQTEKSYLCEENEDNIPAATAQYQTETENFLENQQEINESYSPFKITEDFSTTHAFESLINETPENLLQQEISNSHDIETLNDIAPANFQQPDFNDVDMTASSIADEKHLFEEAKEQNLFSLTGLEQQMSEMVLNKTDGDLLQEEENAEISSGAIEDKSENLIDPDEATNQVIQDQPHSEQAEHLNLVDDSFNRHERECQLQYEQEQKEKELAFNIETKSDLIYESLESTIAQQQQEEMETVEIPMEQQHQEGLKSFETPMVQQQQEEIESFETPIEQESQQKLESFDAPRVQQQQEELESEISAVEEPLIEAKQASTLLTYEETENKMEESHESPLCMVAEIAPAEVLEPTMTAYTDTETEIETKQEDQAEKTEIEIIKEPDVEEPKQATTDTVKEDIIVEPENSGHVPVEAAIVAAAVATTAVVAAKAASCPTTKKPITKTATPTAKPKVASTTAAKKPVEAAKKPIALAAKPRAAPAKPAAGTIDKKSTTTTKKPTATSKVVAKTSTTTTTARTLTAVPKTTTTSKPTATPRTAPASTLTARKPTTTNGPLAKPRPASGPAKPTTLGLSATNGAPKTKPLSPRSTLTSQVRKTTPATTAPKSPVKTTATNGVAKTASSTLTSRTKTTATTLSSTAGTASKTFTARPAPKFTSSASATTTTTTTRRTNAAVSTTSSTTTSTFKASSTALRKSSPAKPMASKTPTKSATGVSKSKTPVSKTASPAAKPAPIRRPVDKTIAAAAAAATNGEANSNNKQLNGLSEEHLNGDMKAVQQEQQQQNGDSSIPMQTEKLEQPFLETRDEQIPMDLINA